MNIQPVKISFSTNHQPKNNLNSPSSSTYQNLKQPVLDTVTFSAAARPQNRFKKAPAVLSGEVVGAHEKFKTDRKKEYTFINSTIKAKKRVSKTDEPSKPIDARIINARNCNIERILEAPDVNLKKTTVSEVRAGNLTMADNSNAATVELRSQTIAHANISDSTIGCVALFTNDPIKGGRNLIDNELTVNNSTIKQIRYPETRPSQNIFYITNNSKIGPMDFYQIRHKQVLDASDSHIEKFIDSRVPLSKITLHNTKIDELRCNPQNLKMSGNNELGDVTFSCFFYEPGDDIEVTIPKGTKINGDIAFEQVENIPGANYIINVEEGAQLNGQVFVLKQNPKYEVKYFPSSSKPIEDKSANLIINRDVKPKK